MASRTYAARSRPPSKQPTHVTPPPIQRQLTSRPHAGEGRTPDLEKAVERATRLGHHFARVNVTPPAPAFAASQPVGRDPAQAKAEKERSSGRQLTPGLGMPVQAHLGDELATEIKRREDRSKEYRRNMQFDIQRPSKPTNLLGMTYTDQSNVQVPQTAHHMVPFNKLKSHFEETVEKGNAQGLKNILAWSGKHEGDTSDLYRKYFAMMPGQARKFGKNVRRQQRNLKMDVQTVRMEDQTRDREREFKSLANAKEYIWAKHNILMGPKPDERSDDPHSSGVDVHRTKKGLTEGSEFAQKISDKGFSGMNSHELDIGMEHAAREHELYGKSMSLGHWGQKQIVTNEEEIKSAKKKRRAAFQGLWNKRKPELKTKRNPELKTKGKYSVFGANEAQDPRVFSRREVAKIMKSMPVPPKEKKEYKYHKEELPD